jgi:hypothetical protein
MLAAGRLEMKDGKIWLDNQPLEKPLEFDIAL